jgi:hypothetical protein
MEMLRTFSCCLNSGLGTSWEYIFQRLVTCNLEQTFDIIEHSKSGLGTKQYSWCYRLKSGSSQKMVFIRKRLSIYNHGGYRHVVRNFVLMADCRICGRVTNRQRRSIFRSLFLFKTAIRPLLYFLFTRLLYIHLKQIISLAVYF